MCIYIQKTNNVGPTATLNYTVPRVWDIRRGYLGTPLDLQFPSGRSHISGISSQKDVCCEANVTRTMSPYEAEPYRNPQSAVS